MRQWRALAHAILLASSSSLLAIRSVSALEYVYSLGYSAEHSNNIDLAPSNARSELINVVDASLSVTENSTEIDARAQTQAVYRDYVHNTFADDTTLGLNGTFAWKILPDRLRWTIDDVYTQTLVNPVAVDTPANRQNANVISTGPDVFWVLDPVNTLQFGARFADNSYSATGNTADNVNVNADNTRVSGYTRWLYRVSPLTTTSLSYAEESVRFADSETNPNFRRQETTVGMANQQPDGAFSLEGGVNRIERKGQSNVEGTIGRLSWQRQLTSESTFLLAWSKSLSDTSRELLARTDPNGAGNNGIAGLSSADIFVLRELRFAYSLRDGVNNVSVTGFRSEREFQIDVANDEDDKGVTLELNRNFSELLNASIKGSYVKSDFLTIDRQDREKTVGVGLQYRLSRTVSVFTSLAQRVHDSTLDGAQFTEHHAVLGVRYTSLPVRR